MRAGIQTSFGSSVRAGGQRYSGDSCDLQGLLGAQGGLADEIGIGPHASAGPDDGAGAVKERAAVDVPEIRAHGRRSSSVVGTDEWHRC